MGRARSVPSSLSVLDAEPVGVGVVEKLKEALAAAEMGELSSVAIAVVYRDGSTGNAWSVAPNGGLQIGSVAVLQWKLANSLVGHLDG